MKKILFLHGFTSSGSCEIVTMLREELEDVAEVVAPDIALRPYEAMAQLLELCDAERFDLIVGSSCGSFYGQLLVRFTGLPAVLISLSGTLWQSRLLGASGKDVFRTY